MSTATTWNSGGSTDANNVGNYSAGLPADAVVTLDATSVVDWIFTANMSVEQINILAAFTGAVTMTGFDLTCSLGFSDDGTVGAHIYGTSITCNGNSSTFHVGAGLASLNSNSTNMYMNGTTAMALDDDKALIIKTLTLGANAVVTSSGAATTQMASVTGPLLTIGNNATFTVNAPLNYRPYNDMTVLSVGTGVTFNGTAAHNMTGGGTNKTFLLSAVTYTGSGTITFTDDANHLDGIIWSLNGAFSWGPVASVIISSGNTTAVRTLNFTTSDNSFTCGTLSIGSPSATTTLNVYFGASTVSVSSFTGAVLNTGVTYDYFQTSSWSCSGNWQFGAAHTVDPGTSTITITNTCTFTSASKSVYNFAINAAARTITFADSLNVAAGGSVTVTAFAAFAGNQYIIFAGSGSITISTNVSNRLRTAVAGSTITWNTGSNVWTFPAYVANDFGGDATGRVSWVSSAPGTQFNIAAPVATISPSYMEFGDANNSTGGTIYCLDGTSVDNGKNVNIIFPSPLAQTGNSNSAISITMGM